ncbi:hypothetical protein EBS02_02340 [bacterium]|nr:hypothetical protein [bacterium]
MRNLFNFSQFRSHSVSDLHEHIDLGLNKKTKKGVLDTSPELPAHDNLLKNSFLSDPLKLKSFIGSLLPNTNLKYEGAGAFGMIFKSNQDLKLDPDFQTHNFTGSLPPSGTPTVLKLTTNFDEAQSVKKFISNQGGSAPGIVRYYWIKEFVLPSDAVWSKLLGAPRKGQETHQERFKDRKEFIRQELVQEFPDLTANKINKMTDRALKTRIDFNRNKKTHKLTKIWIVCLAQVKIPPPGFKDLLNLAFEWFYHCQQEGYNAKKRGSARGVKPISIIKKVYLADKNLRSYYEKINKEFNQSNFLFPSFEEFKSVCALVTNLIDRIWQGPGKPTDYDLHSGNVGLINNQLVAFDLWA